MVGIGHGRELGNQLVVQKPGRRSVPGRRGATLSRSSPGNYSDARVWKALHPLSGLLVALLIAAPWHILAALRNPPYFDFTMRSAPGEYHGFLWFYFINEQLLRFLNMRYPRDYDTVPRLYFWLFHLLWLFPWSVYFPAVAKLSFKPSDARGRRGCWHCAGPASSWCFSLFPPRRSIIRCPAIQRSRCCWDRRWPPAATGSDTARAFCAAYSSIAAAGGAHVVFSSMESSDARRHFRGA